MMVSSQINYEVRYNIIALLFFLCGGGGGVARIGGVVAGHPLWLCGCVTGRTMKRVWLRARHVAAVGCRY